MIYGTYNTGLSLWVVIGLLGIGGNFISFVFVQLHQADIIHVHSPEFSHGFSDVFSIEAWFDH
jgi:hypothetical protein